MKLYSKEQVASIFDENFAFIKVRLEDNVFTLRLNRASKKNALHPQMVIEIAYAMNYAHHEKRVWIVVIEAEGTVFCAGGDLKAMRGNAAEHDSSIPAPTGELLIGEIFNKVHKPVICKVEGNVYAGGFLFLAGSTYVVALDHLKFGLPEVKRGIFPFQVMASMLRVMPARKVLDWCIRGYSISVEQAQDWGLVTHITDEDNLEEMVEDLIAELKENSPSAIQLGMEAFDHILASESEHAYLLEMLMKTIMSKDGQEGLLAFREKRPPVWEGSSE